MAIYHATYQLPVEERYGLSAQMRRAAVSISSNIAEGAGRGTDKDFARFLQMAFGSASELEYQLLLSAELQFLKSDKANELTSQLQEIKRMLSSLLTKLGRKADN